MRRSLLQVLCVAGVAVALGACQDQGSYTVSWQFAGGEPAATGCGAHGVDSIRVLGTSTGGDTDNFAVLCTAGQVTHSVNVGSWTFAVRQVDVRGRGIDPVDPPTAAGDVVKDRNVVLTPDTVELTPRPACSDGVDNDNDGRVDLDDPDCMGDLNGPSECPAAGC
jgi:hypothetical protein